MKETCAYKQAFTVIALAKNHSLATQSFPIINLEIKFNLRFFKLLPLFNDLTDFISNKYTFIVNRNISRPGEPTDFYPYPNHKPIVHIFV